MAADRTFQVARERANAPTIAEIFEEQARQEKIRQEHQKLGQEASDRNYRKMMGLYDAEQPKTPKPHVDRFVEKLKEATTAADAEDQRYDTNGYDYELANNDEGMMT
jgi:hypothetical protein